MQDLQAYFEQFKSYLSIINQLFHKYSKVLFPLAIGLLFFTGSVSLLYGTIILPHFPKKVAASVTEQVEKTYQKVVNPEQSQEKKEIIVDIAGAIEKPGIYTLQNGERLSGLIEKSGGFHKKANKTYIARNVNLSQKLTDEEKIYIPFAGEETAIFQGSSSKGSSATTTSVNGKVNINTGSQAELESLEGIGSVKAAQIIAARPFSSVEDLTEKKIISQKVLSQIIDKVSY